MHQKTEKILATLEVLLEDEIIFRLPYNHTSIWETFIWCSREKGEFNLLSLLANEDWIQLTDTEIAINNWLEIEERGTPVKVDHLAEKRFDEEDYQNRESEEFTNRKNIYEKLSEFLTNNLENLQTYQLGIPTDPWEQYSYFVVVGKIPGGNWICVTSTVPRETKNFEDIIVTENQVILPAEIVLKNSTLMFGQKIQAILENLAPITIYGHYDGGYRNTYQHKIIHKVAETKEEVMELAFLSSGLLEVSEFKTFYPDPEEYIFTDYGGREKGSKIYNKYKHLNQFLQANFAKLIMYKFSFWNYTQIFILGKSSNDDSVGLRLTSLFDYNP
ncbi:MAG: nuclease A inhibitor family protein [Scytonematopsis contorta HA4267-MV1]|jgi:hypothetical protein|nr:nuclease A inhibitor family protein [Scytonematopsis contorta HA4267-MV1]